MNYEELMKGLLTTTAILGLWVFLIYFFVVRGHTTGADKDLNPRFDIKMRGMAELAMKEADRLEKEKLEKEKAKQQEQKQD